MCIISGKQEYNVITAIQKYTAHDINLHQKGRHMNEHFTYQDQLHGESFTPILDSLVPPHSGDTTQESMRAMALTSAHSTAQAFIMQELGEITKETCDELKAHLDRNMVLFLQDMDLVEGGILYDEQGEMFDVSQLTNELIEAVYPKAKYAAIAALRGKEALLESDLIGTRSNIEKLSGIKAQPATSILEVVPPRGVIANNDEVWDDEAIVDHIEAPHTLKDEARLFGGAVLSMMNTGKNLIQKIAS